MKNRTQIIGLLTIILMLSVIAHPALAESVSTNQKIKTEDASKIEQVKDEEPIPLGVNKFIFENHIIYYEFEIWLDEHFADWIIEWGLPGGLGMLCIVLCSALSLTGIGAILVPTVMLAARMIISNYTREQLEEIHKGDGIIIYITDYVPFFFPSPFDSCRIAAQ